MRKKNPPESMIEREMRHSGRQLQIVPVPAAMRPTRPSLQNLEKEIADQTGENETARTRSILLSDRNYSGFQEEDSLGNTLEGTAGQREKTAVNLTVTEISKHASDFDFEEEFEEI